MNEFYPQLPRLPIKLFAIFVSTHFTVQDVDVGAWIGGFDGNGVLNGGPQQTREQ